MHLEGCHAPENSKNSEKRNINTYRCKMLKVVWKERKCREVEENGRICKEFPMQMPLVLFFHPLSSSQEKAKQLISESVKKPPKCNLFLFFIGEKKKISYNFCSFHFKMLQMRILLFQHPFSFSSLSIILQAWGLTAMRIACSSTYSHNIIAQSLETCTSYETLRYFRKD